MQDDSVVPPAENSTVPNYNPNQPGAKAVEALAWAIAQEFVATMDEFHDAVLTEDAPADPPKVRIAGQ